MIGTISFQLLLLSAGFFLVCIQIGRLLCKPPSRTVPCHFNPCPQSVPPHYINRIHSFHYFSLFFHFRTSSCQSDIFYVVKCSDLRLTRHSNVSSWIYDIYGIPFRPRHLPAAAGSAGNVGNPLLPRKSERTHWFYINWCVYFLANQKTNKRCVSRFFLL